MVSVCYPPLITERSVVMEIAQEACQKTEIPDVELGYWKRSLIFNDCPLLKKMRASFRCVQGEAKNGAAPDAGAGDAKPEEPPSEPGDEEGSGTSAPDSAPDSLPATHAPEAPA